MFNCFKNVITQTPSEQQLIPGALPEQDEAEAEGVVGSCDDDPGNRKVVAKRVRLIREATAYELTAMRR